MTTDRVVYFGDRLIEEMTREELLDVIQFMARECKRQSDAHQNTLNTWTRAIDARKERRKSAGRSFLKLLTNW